MRCLPTTFNAFLWRCVLLCVFHPILLLCRFAIYALFGYTEFSKRDCNNLQIEKAYICRRIYLRMGKAVQLTWPNHAKALTTGVAKLFKEDFKTDFELSINGCYVKAHQVILAAFCSKVKREEQSTLILGVQPCLDREDIQLLLDFIYTGKVDVEEDKLFSLKELCDLVGFKALSDIIKSFLVRKKVHVRRSVKKIVKPVETVSAHNVESQDDFGTVSEVDETSDLSKLLESVASNLENNATSSKETEMESIESNEFNCKYCSASFESIPELRLHLMSHKRYKRKFECKHCPYKTDNGTCFATHMISKHQMDVKGNPQPRNIQCPQCSYMCSAQFQLKNHIYNVHSVKRRVCEICGYRCQGNAIMEKHKKLAHSTAKPLMCETCGVRFKIIAHLRKHLTIHQGVKVTCEVCGVSVSANYYSHHKKIHSTNPKPYGCHLCSFSSWKNWNLKFHLKTVHKLHVESGNSKILALQDQNI